MMFLFRCEFILVSETRNIFNIDI